MAAVVLAVVWRVVPWGTPPLYDSLPVQIEPYRYLIPPTGLGNTKPPGSTTKTLDVSDGGVPAGELATDESPPQVQLLFNQGALTVPPGAHTATISVKAVPPPGVQPRGCIDGNVYRITAVTDTGASVQPANVLKPQVNVLLRSAGGQGTPTLERFTGSAWEALSTEPLGSGNLYLGVDVHAFGDFALVQPTSCDANAAPPSSGRNMVLLIVAVTGGLLLVSSVALALVRMGRERQRF